MLKRESPTPLDSRIHLYSDMWRHFDAGLHIFMHTYIYQPLVGSSPTALGRRERLLIGLISTIPDLSAAGNVFVASLCFLLFRYASVLFFLLRPYFALFYRQWVGMHS